MDWTATVINVQDNLPTDLLSVTVDFTNGTDDFQNTYNIHAADYPDVDTFNTFMQGELERFVGIKDVANTLIGTANSAAPVATAIASVAQATLTIGASLQDQSLETPAS